MYPLPPTPLLLQLAGQEDMLEGDTAEHVMLEVQRLWPPFLGGARVCTEVRGVVCIG